MANFSRSFTYAAYSLLISAPIFYERSNATFEVISVTFNRSKCPFYRIERFSKTSNAAFKVVSATFK